jgi:hypothetical protein
MQNRVGPGKGAHARPAGAPAVLDRPYEARLDGRRARIEVGAVERKARFEPKAVARAEPDRDDGTVFQELARERFRLRRRNADLESVLAGVTGPRDDTIRAYDFFPAHVHEAHARDRGSKARQHLLRARSLQCEERAIVPTLDAAAS